jgi:small-conductance mechanosensitive channel
LFLSPLRRALTLLLCLSLFLAFAPRPAWSQGDDGPTPQQQLDGLRQKITAIETKLKGEADLDDATLSAMKNDALAAGAAADKLAVQLEPQLSSVQARLAELGKPAAGVKEAPDVAAQRSQLDHSGSTLDAQLKLARLLSVEADQTSEQVSTARRQDLQERLGERTTSILGGAFWTQLRAEFPQNVQRLRTLAGEIGDAARYTDIKVWAGLLAAVAALIFARLRASRYMLQLTSTRVPAGRLRRSVHALVVTLLALAAPALIAQLLKLGVCWDNTLSDKTTIFLNGFAGIVSFGGFVAGLGYALLAPARPSWRLLPLSDALAQRMRRFPAIFAAVMIGVWTAERLGALINVGLSTAVAVNCIVALLLVATLALGLLRAERAWRTVQQTQRATDAPATAPFWLRTIVVVLWLALATSIVSLVIGYVAFGSFVAKQTSWVIVIVSTTYLLTVLMDDICMLLSSMAPDPADDNAVLPTPKARDQAAVLLSGAGRTVIVLLAIMILLAPFGEGPGELVHRVGQIHDGLAIGEIQIRPGAVIQALVVLVCGFFGLRLLKRWLEQRYLPTTNLDAGMQMSVLTLFGYLGGIVAVALALSAVGIGLERIAWVASALSVGIGFGLQAVVQNFVSGLILLAERPVKVGDWVSLGGVEGDIRRINVRATEIQMGDRSTVIVPNSEFITKTVRNITLASPLGLVQIKLPLPLDTDADAARTLILDAFTDNTDVLDTPAPAVQLDGIDNGYLMFNATGFVSSPRLSYGVRSALLFELLARLKAAKMPISKPSTMLLKTESPAAVELPMPAPAPTVEPLVP